MGTEYSAEVFFGAWVPRKSRIGRKLDEYIVKAGGTPAETEVPGVEIIEVGSWPLGITWMVVRAHGSGLNFGRHDDVEEPEPLTEDPAWRPALAAFFERAKIKDPPPVGWHFAGSVS